MVLSGMVNGRAERLCDRSSEVSGSSSKPFFTLRTDVRREQNRAWK